MEDLSVVYASALFDLATERNAIDEYLSQAVVLRDVLRDAECQRFIKHPQIPSSEKFELIRNAFSGEMCDDLLGLVSLAIAKNREAYLLPALTAFIDTTNRFRKRVTARVTSASPLDEGQLVSLKEMLSNKLGKSVEILLAVESGMIGGPYIDVDGYYVDRTLKKQLHDLTNQMKEGCRV